MKISYLATSSARLSSSLASGHDTLAITVTSAPVTVIP